MCKTKLINCLQIVFLFIFLTFTSDSFGKTSGADAGYRLGSEDVIKISILAGGEEQISKEMIVGESGAVTVPFIGKVQAGGLTLYQLEQKILGPLEEDYFVNPQVHLQVIGYHSLHFFISGAVNNPGKLELDYTPTIMDLIASAGGVQSGRGNLAYILRGAKDKAMSDTELKKSIPKHKPIIVNLKRLLDEGDMSENIRLKSGDTVYIPLNTQLDQSATKVYVEGKVKSPGVFEYQPGLTALAACIMAGGFDKFAAPNRARVIRQTESGQKTIEIDLIDVQKGDEEDLPLEPGDRIHIPESWL